MRKINIIKGIVMILILLYIVDISHAMGIGPALNIIDFAPNSQQELSFRIVNNENKEMKVAIYPQGELAEYIKLEKNIVEIKASESEKEIKYKVMLPEKLNPGSRAADLLVVELPVEETVLILGNKTVIFNEQESMIKATVSLIHQLIVNVPYPKKYVSGKLYIDKANVNETVTFTISLFNIGKESVKKAKAVIVIKAPTGEEIAVIKTNEISLNAQDESKLAGYWTANVGNGNYYAEVIADYDGETFILAKDFSIGDLRIEIEDLKVDNFRLGTIAKFDVLLRSRWNERIPNIYADMQVIDKSGNTMADFKTNIVNLEPKSIGEVSGVWDTAGVEVGKYDVNVKVNYGNKTAEKLFQTIVSVDKIEVQESLTGQVISGKNTKRDSILILIVLILIGINIGWFVYFKRIKKNKQ
jgi:hypothetical protein